MTGKANRPESDSDKTGETAKHRRPTGGRGRPNRTDRQTANKRKRPATLVEERGEERSE